MYRSNLRLYALLFALTIAFTLSTGCEVLRPIDTKLTLPHSKVTDEEEYSLLSALIDEMYPKETVKLMVIQAQTTTFTPYRSNLIETLQRVKEKIPALDEETLKNFQSQNEQSYLLQRLFKLDANYVLISPEKIGDYFGKDGGWWPAYYKDYPESQGLMMVSRVGFNSEMTQALVYASNQSGDLAGEGFFVLLARDKGVWKVKKKVFIWIS
jgi:hypothetical protein